MLVRAILALSVSLCVIVLSPAADDKGKLKSDPTEELIAKLFEQNYQFDGKITEITLGTLLKQMSKKHQITFEILENRFGSSDEGSVANKKLDLSGKELNGLSLHQFLTKVLETLDATYMIKACRIEIVPQSFALKSARVSAEELSVRTTSLAPSGPFPGMDEEDELPWEPLVSFIVKRRTLADAVELLASRYDLNVVFALQAGEIPTEPVSARLLNVPAERVLELLAMQRGLRILRIGNTYLITSREHMRDLANEVVEKEQRKAEVVKLRAGPPDTVPPAPQIPEPEPAKKPDSPKPQK